MLDNHSDGDNKKTKQKKMTVAAILVWKLQGLSRHTRQRSVEPKDLSVSSQQAATQLEVRCCTPHYIVDLFLVLVVIFAGRQL